MTNNVSNNLDFNYVSMIAGANSHTIAIEITIHQPKIIILLFANIIWAAMLQK